MLRPRIMRFRPRRAVSTIIGGLIILALILTGVTGMVFISQQYDQYQQTVNQIEQYESRQFSEKLVFNSPSMTMITSPSIAGWGSGCTTTFNCYNVSISNLGGVGVQIMRIYINSTGSGCIYNPPHNYEQPCILNPSGAIASYAFNQANQFLNPGEVNHGVVLALPSNTTGGTLNVRLPNPTPAFPENSIVIATGRGNVFSFQWPVQLMFYGQTISAFSSGVMKVAYVGYNGGYSSSKEGAGSNYYCHTEQGMTLTGISGVMGKGVGVSGNSLTFVNPWITTTILNSVANDNRTSGKITSVYTQMYVLDYVTNTGQLSYVPTAGTIGLAWYSASHLDGPLIGLYYKGTFYSISNPSALTALSNAGGIAAGTTYYAIYEITIHYISGSVGSNSVMFWGDVSITNGANTSGEDQTYFGGTLLLDGLWIRTESGSSCA